MTSNKQHNSKQFSQLSKELLVSNPLFLLSDDESIFRLDDASFAFLQFYRNQIALEKLQFQVDLDDPNYNLKTLRLLAWFDAKLELLTELLELHVQNISQNTQSENNL